MKIVDLDGCSERAWVQLALHLCEEFTAILSKDCHLILNGGEFINELLDGGFKLVGGVNQFDYLSVGCRLVVQR